LEVTEIGVGEKKKKFEEIRHASAVLPGAFLVKHRARSPQGTRTTKTGPRQTGLFGLVPLRAGTVSVPQARGPKTGRKTRGEEKAFGRVHGEGRGMPSVGSQGTFHNKAIKERESVKKKKK